MQVRPDRQSLPGVNVLRWELANALRQHRIEAGLTVAQAASGLLCSDAKISRMESGQRGASARDVRDLCEIYRVPEQRREELMVMSRESRAVDRQRTSTIPAKYETYVALETTAVSMRNYEAMFVPGLLQTEAYARAVVRGQTQLPDREVEERVHLRLDRQRRLTAKFRPLQVHFMLDENVLWRPIGTPAEREAQLARLVDMSRLPNITLQVMPYAAGVYQGMEAASLVLLDFEDGTKRSTVCYADGMFTDLFLRENSEIERVSAIYEQMKQKALPEEESLALLMRIAGGRYRHWSIK